MKAPPVQKAARWRISVKMSHAKVFVFFGLMAFSWSTFAYRQTDILPYWSSGCVDVAPLKRVQFQSKSGDVTADDMTVSIEWDNSEVTLLPLAAAWYLRRLELSTASAGCAGIGVHRIHRDFVLLVLPFDSRPGWEHLALTLVDLRTRAVIDYRNDVGEITDEYKFKKTGNSVDFLMFKSWRKSSNGGEEGVQRWQKFVVKRGKISTVWQR